MRRYIIINKGLQQKEKIILDDQQVVFEENMIVKLENKDYVVSEIILILEKTANIMWPIEEIYLEKI